MNEDSGTRVATNGKRQGGVGDAPAAAEAGGRGPAGDRTTSRVIRVLRHVAERDEPTTVAALAEDLNLPVSTAHRLLTLLTEEGMVSRDHRRAYSVGWEFHRLAQLVHQRRSMADIAAPGMDRLVAATSEACALGLYRPSARAVAFATVAESPHPLNYRVPLEVAEPIFLGASGRAIMAWLPDAEIRRILDEDVPQRLGEPSVPQIEESLADIRSRGFAVSHGEKLDGAVGIAAPVFNASKRVVACLCLTVPEARFRPEDADPWGELVAGESRWLSHQLGAPA